MQSRDINKTGIAILSLIALPISIWAQESVLPRPFAVYGGSIGVIDAIEVAGTKTRIFASTDSANSVFYADADHSIPEPFGTNFIFRVIPDMDANANFGAPNWLAAHQQSGRLFVGTDSGLVSCTTSAGSLTTPITIPISFVLIQGSRLFALSDAVPQLPRMLYHGTLDTNGNLTLGASPATNFYGSSVVLAVHPVTNKVYVLVSSSTNFVILKSSDDYDAFGSSTTFAPVSSDAVTFQGVGQLSIGPDGRLFVGGGNGSTLQVAWSDDDGGSWTNIDTTGLRAGVGSGLNIVCNGSSNAYEVYFGTAVSTNKGANSSWIGLPRPGGYRPPSMHVNAGCTKIDPNNSQFIYVTTDKGIGGSTNAGIDVVELNNGLLAVQINDIDVLPSKTIAWIGSKSGLRRATNFDTTPIWTDGDFPGPSVNCVTIDSDDPSGMTVYAGDVRLHRTTTGGDTNVSAWVEVFNRDDYGLPDGAIKSVKAKGNHVVLGYYSSTQNSPSGAVYVSTDSGSNWTAALTNVDVNDLVVREEGGAPVIYAAISKSKSGDQGGIYRIDNSSVALDMTNEVNIRKLAEDSVGGIHAAGTLPDTSQPGSHRVVAYYRASNASGWEQLTTNGLPAGLWDGYVHSGELGVITVGKDNATNDVPVLAAVRTLYYLPYGDTEWVIVTNYPNGTRIKTLFWDELMVGTTIGLYGQGLGAEPNAFVEGDFDSDRLADPYMVDAHGNWYIFFSTGHYQSSGAIPLGQAGWQAVAGDFDGDGLADPAMVDAHGNWYFWFSGSHYLGSGAVALGQTGSPVAGDIDGDRKADPAMVDASGNWYIWFSGSHYQPSGAIALGQTGSPVTGDIDGDRKADPTMVDSSGNWYIWFSGSHYQPSGAIQLGNAGWKPVVGDFDGDGKADLATVSNNYWGFRFSSGSYAPVGPILLSP